MKRLAILLLLAAALSATPAAAQTIKSLGYNTTNGFIVYSGTNPLTLTNPLQFATNARAATRTNLGLPLAALTNTNNANFLNAVLGAETNNYGLPLVYNEEEGWIKQTLNYTAISDWYDAVVNGALDTDPEGVRIVLGLSLPALTNTSNATFRSAIGVAPAPIFKVLTNNFSITNQTNMTVVDGLTISTEAGKAYVFELFPILSSEAGNNDLQIVASNATVYGNWDSSGSASYSTTLLTNAVIIGTTVARVLIQKFYVIAGTNAGSIGLQFRSAADTNTNTIGAGSYMMAQEVTPTP